MSRLSAEPARKAERRIERLTPLLLQLVPAQHQEQSHSKPIP